MQILVYPLIAPALIGSGVTLTVIELVAGVHGTGASVVKVNVTAPAVASANDGV